MTHVACELKGRIVVRSSMPRKLGDDRACVRVLWPGLPTRLVQELNVVTVIRMIKMGARADALPCHTNIAQFSRYNTDI